MKQNTTQDIWQRGFSHIVVSLLVVVLSGIGGAAYLVANRDPNTTSKSTTASVGGKKEYPIPPDPQPLSPQPTIDDSEPLASASSGPFTPGGKIVNTVKAELGNGNQAKYGQPGAWCAAFSIWAFKQNGSAAPSGVRYHNVKELALWAQRHGKWTTKPNVGYMAVYGKRAKSKADSVYVHVGIVADMSFKGNKVKMIDGNWGDRVAYHRSDPSQGGPLWSKYNNFYTTSNGVNYRVAGFIRP